MIFQSQSRRSYLLLLGAAVAILTTTRAQVNAAFDCIDLTSYANDDDKLATLLAGGDLEDADPVYFDIDGGFSVNGEVTFCLENIKIPDSVDGKPCDSTGSSGNCMLALGKKSKASESEKEYCDDLFGNSASCFACMCGGTDMSTGSLNETTWSGCGMQSTDRWALTCQDVTNGRLVGFDYTNGEEGQVVYSDFATAHISICPDSFSRCSFCGGGVMPSFRIGVQWISNLEEQCFDHPFGQGKDDDGLGYGAIVGISVGVAVLIGAIFVVWNKKKQVSAAQQADDGARKANGDDEERQ